MLCKLFITLKIIFKLNKKRCVYVCVFSISSNFKILKSIFIIFQDRPYARDSKEIAATLGLSEQWASNIIWAVAPVCGLTGEGIDGALHTLRALIEGTRINRKTNKKK